MNKYRVELEWSGYSRGYAIYEVEAESEEAAMEDHWSGVEVERETVRDDTDSEVISAELISEDQSPKELEK